MNEFLYEKLGKLCKEYYPSSETPVRTFANTLRGADKKLLIEILSGKRPPEADETLVRCIQILSVRKKNTASPYGYYDK